MTKDVRTRLIYTLLTLAVTCVFIGVCLSFALRPPIPPTVEDLDLSMGEASVMIDGVDQKNGLTFSAKIERDKYSYFFSFVGKDKAYKSVETGVIIAPKYYDDNVKIDANSLFGKDPVYDYANYVDGAWVYDKADKIRVININANDWVLDGDYYYYSGSIVDIKKENLTTEFFATAYVLVKDGDGDESISFAKEGVCTSVALCAQNAISKGVLSGEKAQKAKELFILSVTEKFSYTTEIYVKDKTGYVLKETILSSDKYALDTLVYAEYPDYSSEGLSFEESNVKNLLSGRILADNGLVLRRYYKESLVTVIGFDSLSNVYVPTGSKVVITKPNPVNQYGEPLNVYFDVTNSLGGFVPVTTSGKESYFMATDTSYQITYGVYTENKTAVIKTTNVTVVGSDEIRVTYDDVVTVGDTISLNASCELQNCKISYSVVKSANTDVPLNGDSFIADTAGEYTVTVTASSQAYGLTSRRTYKVFAIPKKTEGQIEKFDSTWEDYRNFLEFGTDGWKITSSNSVGVKDKNDNDGYFAQYSAKSSENLVKYYINPAFIVSEYKNLSSKGYESVVFYVYIKGNTPKKAWICQDVIDKSTFNNDLGLLLPNTWNRVEIPLVETEDNRLERSFISGCNIWLNKLNGFLCVDNSSKETFDILISDVFAVKKQTILVNPEAKNEYMLGDVVDLSNFIVKEKGLNYEYYLKNESTLLSEEKTSSDKINLTESGKYVLTAKVVSSNVEASVEIPFNVDDGLSLDKDNATFLLTTSNVDLLDLGAVIRLDGTALNCKYTVLDSDGVAVSVNGSIAKISRFGVYKVYVTAEYGLYKSNKLFTLNVTGGDGK